MYDNKVDEVDESTVEPEQPPSITNVLRIKTTSGHTYSHRSANYTGNDISKPWAEFVAWYDATPDTLNYSPAYIFKSDTVWAMIRRCDIETYSISLR